MVIQILKLTCKSRFKFSFLELQLFVTRSDNKHCVRSRLEVAASTVGLHFADYVHRTKHVFVSLTRDRTVMLNNAMYPGRTKTDSVRFKLARLNTNLQLQRLRVYCCCHICNGETVFVRRSIGWADALATLRMCIGRHQPDPTSLFKWDVAGDARKQ